MTVDKYLTRVTPEQLAEYKRVQDIVKRLVPEASEVISYGIPTFKYKGTYLLYFGAFKNHMSLFPGSYLIDGLKSKLDGYKIAKGTIQFTADKPLAESVIEELILLRRNQIDNK